MMFLRYDSKHETYNIMVEIPGLMLNDKQKMLARKAHDSWLLFKDKNVKVHVYQEKL